MRAMVSDWPQVQRLSIILIDLCFFTCLMAQDLIWMLHMLIIDLTNLFFNTFRRLYFFFNKMKLITMRLIWRGEKIIYFRFYPLYWPAFEHSLIWEKTFLQKFVHFLIKSSKSLSFICLRTLFLLNQNLGAYFIWRLYLFSKLMKL